MPGESTFASILAKAAGRITRGAAVHELSQAERAAWAMASREETQAALAEAKRTVDLLPDEYGAVPSSMVDEFEPLTWYHETNAPDFSEFSVKPHDVGVHMGSARAAQDRFLVNSGYSAAGGGGSTEGARTLDLRTRRGRYLSTLGDQGDSWGDPVGWRTWATEQRRNPASPDRDIANEMLRSGLLDLPPWEFTPAVRRFMGERGVLGADYANLWEDPGSISRVVFEPENIRSTRAAFDPAKRNSRDILAGGAAAAGAGSLAALAAPDEADARGAGLARTAARSLEDLAVTAGPPALAGLLALSQRQEPPEGQSGFGYLPPASPEDAELYFRNPLLLEEEAARPFDVRDYPPSGYSARRRGEVPDDLMEDVGPPPLSQFDMPPITPEDFGADRHRDPRMFPSTRAGLEQAIAMGRFNPLSYFKAAVAEDFIEHPLSTAAYYSGAGALGQYIGTGARRDNPDFETPWFDDPEGYVFGMTPEEADSPEGFVTNLAMGPLSFLPMAKGAGKGGSMLRGASEAIGEAAMRAGREMWLQPPERSVPVGQALREMAERNPLPGLQGRVLDDASGRAPFEGAPTGDVPAMPDTPPPVFPDFPPEIVRPTPDIGAARHRAGMAKSAEPLPPPSPNPLVEAEMSRASRVQRIAQQLGVPVAGLAKAIKARDPQALRAAIEAIDPGVLDESVLQRAGAERAGEINRLMFPEKEGPIAGVDLLENNLFPSRGDPVQAGMARYNAARGGEAVESATTQRRLNRVRTALRVLGVEDDAIDEPLLRAIATNARAADVEIGAAVERYGDLTARPAIESARAYTPGEEALLNPPVTQPPVPPDPLGPRSGRVIWPLAGAGAAGLAGYSLLQPEDEPPPMLHHALANMAPPPSNMPPDPPSGPFDLRAATPKAVGASIVSPEDLPPDVLDAITQARGAAAQGGDFGVPPTPPEWIREPNEAETAWARDLLKDGWPWDPINTDYRLRGRTSEPPPFVIDDRQQAPSQSVAGQQGPSDEFFPEDMLDPRTPGHIERLQRALGPYYTGEIDDTIGSKTRGGAAALAAEEGLPPWNIDTPEGLTSAYRAAVSDYEGPATLRQIQRILDDQLEEEGLPGLVGKNGGVDGELGPSTWNELQRRGFVKGPYRRGVTLSQDDKNRILYIDLLGSTPERLERQVTGR